MDMEYAKDDIFQIRYNTELNKLKLGEENGTSRVYHRVKKHKLLTTLVIALFMFGIVNMVMIVSFMRILQRI